MLFKGSPKYQAAMKAAKLIKKTRNPQEKRNAVARWCEAARKLLGE